MTSIVEMTGWSSGATSPLASSATGTFSQMASTTSIPEVTVPKAAYCPSSEGVVCCMMKNCELAESGSLARAIEMVPRVCGMLFATPLAENSPLIAWSEPPVPSPAGSPPWIMKPGTTRWNVRPS